MVREVREASSSAGGGRVCTSLESSSSMSCPGRRKLGGSWRTENREDEAGGGVLGTENLDSGTVKNDTKLGFPYNAV